MTALSMALVLLAVASNTRGENVLKLTKRINAHYEINTVEAPFSTGEFAEKVLFRMLVPAASLITGLDITVNNVTCSGVVEEEHNATVIFEEAKREGLALAWISRIEETDDPNVVAFETEISVPERSDGKFVFTYESRANRTKEPFEVRMDLNMTMMFDSVDARFEIKEDLDFIQNLTETSAQISVNSIGSPVIENKRWEQDNEYIFRFTSTLASPGNGRRFLLKGNFVVKYNIRKDQRNLETFVSQEGVAALLSVNKNINDVRDLDLTVVMDISGSMGGEVELFNRESQETVTSTKLDASIDAIAEDVLDRLKPNDRISFIPFNHGATVLGQEYYIGTKREREEARRLLIGVKQDGHNGGTSINGALEKALELANKKFNENPDKTVPAILIYTDGHGWMNTTTVKANIKQKNPGCFPIYSVAIGGDAKVSFLQELSDQNCGKSYDASSSDNLVDDLEAIIRSVEKPLYATGIKLEISSPCLEEGTATNEIKDLKGAKFIDHEKPNIELANVQFKKNITRGTKCEITISYNALIQNKTVHETIKICFEPGYLGNYQKFVSTNGSVNACPDRLDFFESQETPRIPFNTRLSQYNEIKKGTKNLEVLKKKGKIEEMNRAKQELAEKAKSAGFVVRGLTALVTVVDEQQTETCQPLMTKTVNFENSAPIKSFSYENCMIQMYKKTNFRGEYSVHNESVANLNDENDKVGSIRVRESSPGACSGFYLYKEENFGGVQKLFPVQDYPSFKDMGEFFKATKSIKPAPNSGTFQPKTHFCAQKLDSVEDDLCQYNYN